jgi:hypothetical protein
MKYLVVIIWNEYEVTCHEFRTLAEARAYYREKANFPPGYKIYLAKIMEDKIATKSGGS